MKRLICSLSLLLITNIAFAEIAMRIEQPVANSINTGVSLIRGWAVDSEEVIDSIEIQIDDHRPAIIPYGDPRGVIGQQYDGWPNSYNSGFSGAVDWGNYSNGDHVIKLTACTVTNNCKTVTSNFTTVKYHFDYGLTPEIGSVSKTGSIITLNDVSIGNETYDVMLDWQFPSQQWVINSVIKHNDIPDPNPDLTAENQEFLNLINDLRISLNLNPLEWDAHLALASQLHSQDMADQNYFDHTGLDGSHFSQRARDAGFTGWPLGENIAAGNSNVASTFNQWFNSSGHYANMTNSNATLVGFGQGSNPTSQWRYYSTMIIGR